MELLFAMDAMPPAADDPIDLCRVRPSRSLADVSFVLLPLPLPLLGRVVPPINEPASEKPPALGSELCRSDMIVGVQRNESDNSIVHYFFNKNEILCEGEYLVPALSQLRDSQSFLPSTSFLLVTFFGE